MRWSKRLLPMTEVLKRYEEADVVIMAAAVADYRPEKFYDEKVKKSDGD